MGYGTRALELLTDYYEGKFTSFDDIPAAPDSNGHEEHGVSETDLHAKKLRPKKHLPPLFVKVIAFSHSPLLILS